MFYLNTITSSVFRSECFLDQRMVYKEFVLAAPILFFFNPWDKMTSFWE